MNKAMEAFELIEKQLWYLYSEGIIDHIEASKRWREAIKLLPQDWQDNIKQLLSDNGIDLDADL